MIGFCSSICDITLKDCRNELRYSDTYECKGYVIMMTAKYLLMACLHRVNCRLRQCTGSRYIRYVIIEPKYVADRAHFPNDSTVNKLLRLAEVDAVDSLFIPSRLLPFWQTSLADKGGAVNVLLH